MVSVCWRYVVFRQGLNRKRAARSHKENHLACLPSWDWGWNTSVGVGKQGAIIAVISNWFEANLPNKRHGDEMITGFCS